MKMAIGSRRARWLAALWVTAIGLAAASPAAQAAPDDPLFVYDISKPTSAPSPPPVPPFEGPCGIGVDTAGTVYVSDYHHHLIDLFHPRPLPSAPPLEYVANIKNVDSLGGPCGLSLDAVGNLYVNNFHRNVERFARSTGSTFAPPGIVDAAHPTGVAVDSASGTVYVNDRTFVAAYGATGDPVLDGDGNPLRIGLGSLEDAYGLAVSRFPGTAGYLYVPDAGDETIKVYDPAVDLATPVQVIDGAATPSGGFPSLDDSAVAVDDVSGEVYVSTNVGPAFFERPQAAIHVFDPAGVYQGRLKHNVVDAEPPGLAVDNSGTATQGRVYVTSGNSEKSVLYAYPPGAATEAELPPAGETRVEGAGLLASLEASAPSTAPPPPTPSEQVVAPRSPEALSSEIAQKGNLRVTVKGKLAPRRLPRRGAAPIAVTVSGKVSTTDRTPPPQLKTLRIELNRNGRLDHTGLPLCPYARLQPASSDRALAACRSALVGKGSFTADVTLGGDETYVSSGRLLVFNGRRQGKRVLFGHLYAARPFASSFVIVFAIQKLRGGTYGAALSAALPAALGSWGNLTGLEMTLSRRYSYKHRLHSYISSGCPAPKGSQSAVFPLARTTFGFDGGKKLRSVLIDSCRARD
jgi:hypothetical protein